MIDPRWTAILRPFRRWSRSQVEAHQLRCLRAVVRHAASSVPFYRDRFAGAGLDPGDLTSLAAIEKLPITDKEDIQSAARSSACLRATDRRRLVHHVSSGTTGEPLTVLRTRFEERLLQAFRIRVMLRLGLRLTDRRIDIVWDGPDTSLPGHHERLGLLRRRAVSCRLPADAIIASLRDYRPDALKSLPSVLAWLIDQLDESSGAAIRPRTVWIGGEATSPLLRSRFTERFGTTVRETYGSNEFNLLAWECPEGFGFHVADPTVLLEVRRGDRPALPGEDGEVIATALCSRTMPFIRYRLGDLARRGPTPCPCGAPWSTIERIQGRMVERFVRPDGSTYHPWGLGDAVMESAPWVQRFRVEQQSVSSIRLLVKPFRGHTPGPQDRHGLVQAVRLAAGDFVDLQLRVVDDLEPGAGRKSQPYLCCVPRLEASPAPRAVR